ncbi:TPA: hypothetical protein SB541_001204 [Campylobacter jejuni]|nr:hypothetical protein [Campylobacter jejuni]
MIWKNTDLIKVDFHNTDFEHINNYSILTLNNYIAPEYIEINFLNKVNQIDIAVEILDENKQWCLCQNTLNEYDKIKLLFYGEQKLRSIRFNRSSYDLILDVKIFVRTYPGIFMAKSYAGWGDRMLALLNAMYLAKQTNFKFGFTWDELNVISKENKQISYIHIPSEDKLFNKEFLEKHSYTNQYTSPDKEKLIFGEWITNSVAYKDNIRDFFKKPFEYYWGYVTNHAKLSYMIKDVDVNYMHVFPKLWKEIGFSKNIKNIFTEIDKICLKIQDNFVAIHVRSGDIVYPTNEGYLYNGTGHDYLWQKAMPVEILLELIQQYAFKNQNIILFGEDVATLRQVVSYTRNFLKKNKNYIYLANDFIDGLYQQKYEKDIFDLVFMSRASEIIGGASGFCFLASSISQGKEPILWMDLFNEQKRYDIFRKYYGVIQIHPLQNAFSLQHMYMGEFYLTKNIHKMEDLVLQALEIDQTREFHHIILLYCYLTLNKMEEAEKYLEKIIKDRKDKFIYIILKCIIYEDFKNTLFKNEKCLSYVNLSYLMMQFINHEKNLGIKSGVSYYHEDSAVFRIKNSLSYRFGNEMIRANSFLKILRLPFILLKIMLKFRKEQKIYQYVVKQNPKLALRCLQEYPDYYDALKLKNHLSYRLGNALIKHPFTFIYKIKKIISTKERL